jgi:hypothetical protein
MKYACRSLPRDLAPQDLEAKLNQAATHGWECASVTQRHADLLIVFRGDFSNIGDLEIATMSLDSAI